MPSPIIPELDHATARAKFLEALSQGYTVAYAAQVSGRTKGRWYQIRSEDEEFKQIWDEAVEIGTEYIEDEARRRAVDGVTKPVFYQGEVCGHVQEYSDTLLVQLLKARRPEKYRENINHNHTGNITVTRVNFAVIEGEAEEVRAIEPLT